MTLFDGFYQMGFVARDLDRAVAALGMRYGLSHFRQKRADATMRSAHAYVGHLMLEVIEVSEGGHALYRDHLPAGGDSVRLHHHGFLITDEVRWDALVKHVDSSGLATPLRGAVMHGHLRYLYADTRAELGIYSEYVFLTGPALHIYDDVPRN
jgi:hypothetical protein